MNKTEKFLVAGVLVSLVLSVFAISGGASQNLQGRLSNISSSANACENDVTEATILFSYDGDDAQFSDIYNRAKNGEFKCNYEISIVGAGKLICRGRDLVASDDGSFVHCIKSIGGMNLRASIMGNGVEPAGMMAVFYGNAAITEGFADRVDIYQVPNNFRYSPGTGR